MLVPFALTAATIVYAWAKIFSYQYHPVWRHYTALFGFLIVLGLFLRSRRMGTVALGIYLAVAITTVVSLTAEISYWGFAVGTLQIPIGNPVAWGLFIVYGCLNMTALFDYYLDYKESNGGL